MLFVYLPLKIFFAFALAKIVFVATEEIYKNREIDERIIRLSANTDETDRNLVKINKNAEFAMKLDGNAWKKIAFQQLLDQVLGNCRIVVVKSSLHDQSDLFLNILGESEKPFIYFDLTVLESKDSTITEEFIGRVIYSFPLNSCLTLVADLPSVESWELLEKNLKSMRIDVWPDIKTIFFGESEIKEKIMTSYNLRNSKWVNYISYKSRLGKVEVSIERRCFYCDKGNEKIVEVTKMKDSNNFKITKNIFPEIVDNFYGHKFLVTTLSWYPFIAYEQIQPGEPCPRILFKDSLNSRIMKVMTDKFNFRYEMREPCDGQWGTNDENGNFSGIVGTLQHNQADVTVLLSLYHSRLAAVDYTAAYTLSPLIFVALKPSQLAKTFALVKPFSPMSWGLVAFSIFFASLIFWKIPNLAMRLPTNKWRKNKYQRYERVLIAVFQMMLLEPLHFWNKIIPAARLFLLGWWLFCVVVTSMFKASLLADLTLPTRSEALHTIEQLVEHDSVWSWGKEPLYDVTWTWFRDNENSHVQTLFKKFELMELDAQMEKVLKGNYAFFSHYYYVLNKIKSEYTNAAGYTPFYVSDGKYLNYGGYAWAFRKGHPMRMKFDKILRYIGEAGWTEFWLNELMEQKNENKNNSMTTSNYNPDADEWVSLSLTHLEGPFYILAIGLGISTVAFIVEVIVGKCKE